MVNTRRAPVSSASAYQELRVFDTDEVEFDMDHLDLPDLDHTVRIRAQRRRFWLRMCITVVMLTTVGALGLLGFTFIRGGFGSTDNDFEETLPVYDDDGYGSTLTPPPTSAPVDEPVASGGLTTGGEPTSPPGRIASPEAVTDTPSPILGADTTSEAATRPAPVKSYRILDSFPHDRNAFTQGFLYADGIFYESTGLRGSSSLRKVAIESGRVRKEQMLEDQYFAEGLALVGEKLYQVTWQSNKGFIYSSQDFSVVGSWDYEGEGWGLTPNENSSVIYMSDGSSSIRVLDPGTLDEVGPRISVTDNDQPVRKLNELEFINGEIWANIWLTDKIAIIDPASGIVTSWVDCRDLLQPEHVPAGHRPDVLNGIAYDPSSKSLYLTGKKWPRVYKIEVVD